jgi:hypothetical protein
VPFFLQVAIALPFAGAGAYLLGLSGEERGHVRRMVIDRMSRLLPRGAS